MDALIENNYRWWNKRDDEIIEPSEWISSDVSVIKNDNPTYDIELLKKINKWVITVDSQESSVMFDLKDKEINHYYCKFLQDSWGYSYSDLKNTSILEYYQKPYLELVTNYKNGDLLWDAFLNNTKYGFIMTQKTFTKSNKKFKSITDDTLQKFQLKNSIALTWQKTKHDVKNRYLKKSDKWLNPTNFPVNYRDHLSEEFTRYDYKMCKIFIVGEDCLLNTNEIFKIIYDTFKDI